jgi:hypothetical protein
MICETCQRPVEFRTGGRPRTYCSHECREYAKAMRRLAALLPAVLDNCRAAGDAAVVELRYEAFTFIADEYPRPRHPKGHPLAGTFISRKG